MTPSETATKQKIQPIAFRLWREEIRAPRTP